MATDFNKKLNNSGFNFNARDPYRLLPYQQARDWIEAYREKWGKWPTRGNCPADEALFSSRTFARALKDMKEWETDK